MIKAQLSDILGVSKEQAVRIATRRDFPKRTVDGRWSRKAVEEWAAIPRCVFGLGQSKCWEPCATPDTYWLHMCEKHKARAEEILRKSPRTNIRCP